jgi:hypothetical protein
MSTSAIADGKIAECASRSIHRRDNEVWRQKVIGSAVRELEETCC